MSRGVNKVIIVGNLGNDPENRVFNNGSSVTTISIATSDGWKDKATGEQQERVEWHRVQLFNKLAEIAHQYLKKGSKVYIEGSLRTRKWQDKDGKDMWSTDIIAREMQMLSSKSGGSDGAEKQDERLTDDAKAYQEVSGSNVKFYQEASGAFEDDVPF